LGGRKEKVRFTSVVILRGKLAWMENFGNYFVDNFVGNPEGGAEGSVRLLCGGADNAVV
jgi:hypothetical protein